MTENNYSIFDDVTMPEYLKDKNLPEHYLCGADQRHDHPRRISCSLRTARY